MFLESTKENILQCLEIFLKDRKIILKSFSFLKEEILINGKFSFYVYVNFSIDKEVNIKELDIYMKDLFLEYKSCKDILSGGLSNNSKKYRFNF